MIAVAPAYSDVLGFQRVPLYVVAATAVATTTLVASGLMMGYPIHLLTLLTIALWLPALLVETAAKYQRYGWLAVFMLVCLLQVGHLGEHTAQVTQLFMNDGTLAHSHGIIGRLDFEAVHFWWDTGVWLSTLALVWYYAGRNRWLWLSLFFASAHEVEHMYLYYINVMEPAFYDPSGVGGFAGLLGAGGFLPTLARPYLHYSYNLLVVLPLVIAFLREVDRANATLNRVERITAHVRQRRVVEAGVGGAPHRLLIAGLAIGGGTKPLHDLVSRIEKAKENAQDQPAVGV